MSYSSLLAYVKDLSKSLNDEVLFVHGRKEVIHELAAANPDHEGLVFWSFPFESSATFTEIGQQLNELVSISFIIYKQDYMGSEIDQNNPENTSDETLIVAQTKDLADQFVRLFNFNEVSSSLTEISEGLEIQSISFEPVEKDNDYLLTGTFVNMSVLVPDKFNYCSIL